jgi:hypothetical protein
MAEPTAEFKKLRDVAKFEDLDGVAKVIASLKSEGADLVSILVDQSAPPPSWDKDGPRSLIIFEVASRYEKRDVPKILRLLINEIPPPKRAALFAQPLGMVGRNLLHLAVEDIESVRAVCEGLDEGAFEELVFAKDKFDTTAKLCLEHPRGHAAAVYIYNKLAGEIKREEFVSSLDEGNRRMFFRDILPQAAEKVEKEKQKQAEEAAAAAAAAAAPAKEEVAEEKQQAAPASTFRYSAEAMTNQFRALGRAAASSSSSKAVVIAELRRIADSDGLVSRASFAQIDKNIVSVDLDPFAPDGVEGTMSQDIFDTKEGVAAGLEANANADRATVKIPVSVVIEAYFGSD